MPFAYTRTIHFPDTDAAGVVFFPRYLAICHEAYEEAIAAAGLDVARFFSTADGLVLPVSKSSADYLRPLHVGDKLRVTVTPTRLTDASFALDYEMFKITGPTEKLAARVRTEHVCITTATRERTPLPSDLAAWVDGA